MKLLTNELLTNCNHKTIPDQNVEAAGVNYNDKGRATFGEGRNRVGPVLESSTATGSEVIKTPTRGIRTIIERVSDVEPRICCE